MYLNLLKYLQHIKQFFLSALGSELENVLEDFAENLYLAHIYMGLPISPKLHVIAKYMPQAVRELGPALGKVNESSKEAAHSIFVKINSSI